MLPVRQEPGPAVRRVVRRIELRGGRRRAPARRNAREPAPKVGREHDVAAPAPRASTRRGRIAEDLGRAARGLDRLQLSAREETDGSTVGGPERKQPALGRRQRRGHAARQRLDPESSRTRRTRSARRRARSRAGRIRPPSARTRSSPGEARRSAPRPAAPIGAPEAEARGQRGGGAHERDRPRRLASRCGGARATAGCADEPDCDPSPIQRSSRFKSLADCQRSSGSLARQVRTMRSSAAGDVGCERRDRRRLARHDRRDQRRLVGARERLLPGRHLVEHGAEREDVGAPVGFLALELLGRHVLERPENRAFLRQALLRRQRGRAGLLSWRRHRLREPEVEQLHARLRQHDVGGLQVPVHDPLPVRLVEGVGDLGSVAQRRLERQRALGQAIAESVSPSRNSMTRYSFSPSRPTS